jgi:hypothetical protein
MGREEVTPRAEEYDATRENSRNLPHQFPLWVQKLMKLPSLLHNFPHYEKKLPSLREETPIIYKLLYNSCS